MRSKDDPLRIPPSPPRLTLRSVHQMSALQLPPPHVAGDFKADSPAEDDQAQKQKVPVALRQLFCRPERHLAYLFRHIRIEWQAIEGRDHPAIRVASSKVLPSLSNCLTSAAIAAR